MKFQSAAFSSLIGLAAANPILDINIHAGNDITSKGMPALMQDVCLKVCWPSSPQCPDGWYSSNKGDSSYACWTCCKALEYPAISSHSKAETGIELVPDNEFRKELAMHKHDFSAVQDEHCLMICAQEPLQCGHPMYQKKFGDCNTCCFKSDMLLKGKNEQHTLSNKPTQGKGSTMDIDIHTDVGPAAPKSKSLTKQDVSTYQICLRICWPESPQCPGGWYSSNLGTGGQPCWTCCRAPEIEDKGLNLQITEELK